MPSPRLLFAREAPALVDLGALPDVRGDLAQRLPLRLRQDEVVPGRGRLDALRQVIQRAGGPAPGRRPTARWRCPPHRPAPLRLAERIRGPLRLN